MDGKNSDISGNGFKLVMRYRSVLMGIATIWIFIFHVWIPVIREPSHPILTLLGNIESFIRQTGFCGVDIFLLLSGMGLTYAIRKQSVPKFYYRRIRRVFLPFLVAALISWPALNWDFMTFLRNVSGYNFYAVHVNSFCWFVPAIITLYLFFPLYYKLFDKAKNKAVFTLLAKLVWLLLTVLLIGKMRIDMYGFTNRIPIFIIGILFGHIAQDKENVVFKVRHYVLLLLIFIAGNILAYMYVFKGFELVIPDEKLIAADGLIAVSLPFLAAKLMDILERRVPRLGKVIDKGLGFWGKISLELYCVYTCVIVPLFKVTVLRLANLGIHVLLINLIIFIVCSAISWIAVFVFDHFWKLTELPKARKQDVK